jgi:UDP-N-acetylglucosamine--N-acetylmuramyl-(pentapeptide) pyrophosphoryl-undecaprenol N-acetylglucosamine transferase
VSEKKQTVILAAGGTGGHIFPAEALASELIKRGVSPILITDKRFEDYQASNVYDEILTISSATLSGNFVSRMKGLLSIIKGILKARKLIKKYKPEAVVGFGGYPSFPTMIAAISLSRRTVIHEQNSVLGRVNRVLLPMVGFVAVAFDNVKHIAEKFDSKVVFTGNPVRSAIKVLRDVPFPELSAEEHLHILVTGGSQGASVFAEIVPKAIALLPEEYRKRVRIDQQCREVDIQNVKAEYDALGVNADLSAFFVNMPARMASCHLLIGRAGASTIAEVTVTGRASILIPYPYAMDDHQTGNAESMAANSATILLSQTDMTAEIIAQNIQEFLDDPTSLQQLAMNAYDLGVADAEIRLADVVLGG